MELSTEPTEVIVSNNMEIPESEDEDQNETEDNNREPGEINVTFYNNVTGGVASTSHTPQLPNLAVAALQRLAAANEDSPDDFRPLKKRKIQETIDNDATTDNENEGQICSICFDPWTNSGGHRIASLRCGHLFGYSCIEKWLKGTRECCPQCNSKAKKGDIRVIYSKSISVVDTTERDRALKELEEEKTKCILAQKSEAHAILQYQLAKAECERLKLELKQVKEQLEYYVSNKQDQNGGGVATPITKPTSHDNEGQFVPLKVLTISNNGGARVIGQDSTHNVIVASKPSSNRLFPGWGVTKVSLMDLKSSEFIPVHEKCIRDVRFSPRGDGLILTTGLDKTLQLTSIHSNTVVQSYSMPVPGWACCWNEDEPNYMYCGLMNGSLLTFDLRRTDSHVTQLTSSKNVPITSLSYVPLCRASTLNCSGILTGTLDGGVFWEKTHDSYTQHHLDCLLGACTSISFEPSTRHCMASFRPSKRTPQNRHIICQLRNTPLGEPFACHALHQFNGGSSHRLLSRSCLFERPHQSGQLIASYGDESSKMTFICDVSTTSQLQKLPTDNEPCLDIAITATNNRDILLTLLTEHKLHLYQWQQVH